MTTLRKSNPNDAAIAAILVTLAAIQYSEALHDFRKTLDSEALDHQNLKLVRDATAFFNNTVVTGYVAQLNLKKFYNLLTSQFSNVTKKELTNMDHVMALAALVQLAGTFNVVRKQLASDTTFELNMDFIMMVCNIGMTLSLAGPSIDKAANKVASYFSSDSTVGTMWNKGVAKVADCVTHAKEAVKHYVPGMRLGGD